MKKYIITGGPYSGKSSVLELLEKQGIQVMRETARLIIREDQEKKKSDPSYQHLYPWEDQSIFCRRCHERQMEREKELSGDMVILDRSIIDNLAYAAVEKIELNPKIYKDIDNAGYEKKVFFLELLPSYKTDTQRKDSEEQVKAVHRELHNVYSSLGFEIISIPVFSDDKDANIMKRAEFILEHILSTPV
ncbi:MAG: AAA family ATPase [Desulfobacteraceae bacterium]|jgi:predicted ATPase